MSEEFSDKMANRTAQRQLKLLDRVQQIENAKRQKKTFMRIDKDLLKEINDCKIARAESYADVVKRLIDKERRAK